MTTETKTTRLDARNVRLDLDTLFRARYERARSNYGVVIDAEATIAEPAGTLGNYVARDLFAGVYAPNTPVDAGTDGAPVRRILDWATTELERMPEWRGLATTAKGNVVASALATEAVVKHLAALEWPKPPEADDDAGNPDRMTRDNAGMPESFECWQDGATVHTRRTRNGKPSTTSRAFGSADAAKRAVEQATRKARAEGFQSGAGTPANGQPNQTAQEAYEAALTALADGLTNDPTSGPMFRGAIVGAVRKAAQDAKDATEAMVLSYGLDGVEDQLSDPDPEAARIAEGVRKSKSLADFLRHIGRFLDAMKTSPVRQRVRGHVMPYDVSTTRDFRRLVPSELALLAHPATRAQQTVRVVSGQALGWQMADMGAKARGPMHVALDMSGSMQSQQTIAKAFAVAACLHAADNGRPVTASVFTTTVRPVTSGLDTPKDRARFVGDILTIDANGGTDFRPLVNHIAKLAAPEDVLLISDGCGAIDDNRAREVFATRALHYLVIGDDRAVDPTLRALAEGRMMTADNLLGDAVADFAAGAGAAR